MIELNVFNRIGIYEVNELTLLTTIPYGLIFLYGLRITSFSQKDIRSHFLFFLTLFLSCLVIGYLLDVEKLFTHNHLSTLQQLTILPIQ